MKDKLCFFSIFKYVSISIFLILIFLKWALEIAVKIAWTNYMINEPSSDDVPT